MINNLYNENSGEDKSNEEKEATQNIIRELGIISTGTNFKSEVHYISIIGNVEGHMVLPPDNKTTKYEHLIPQIIAVEENPEIKGLLVVLNTVGGDVEAGLALAELISSISKPTVSLVLGGGHSIGIPLAVSSDYSFICATATMTLHPVRTSGLVITAESTFEQLLKTQERIVEFIVAHSKADENKILELMNSTGNMANDVGTLLAGQEAVKIGLIDEVGGLTQALTKLRELIKKNSDKNAGSDKAMVNGKKYSYEDLRKENAGADKSLTMNKNTPVKLDN